MIQRGSAPAFLLLLLVLTSSGHTLQSGLTIISFEEPIVGPGRVLRQYCQGTDNEGVEFLAPGGRLIRPDTGRAAADPEAAPRSPRQALTNQLSSESFDASDPLAIAFTTAQDQVTVYAGLHRIYPFEVIATLAAYSGARPGTGFLTSVTVNLGVGPKDITVPLSVAAAGIRSVSLRYEGAGVGQFGFEVIDDLTFSKAGPACGGASDTTAPSVQILAPVRDGLTLYNPDFILSLVATERESSMASVEVEYLSLPRTVLSSFSVCGGLSSPGCGGGRLPHVESRQLRSIAPTGTTAIRVSARDIFGNTGTAVRRVRFTAPSANTNLWIQGMEVTQGIQSWVARSSARRSSTPIEVMWNQTAATSLVADKRTIVRVYPGLAGSGGVPIVGAGITLTCRYKDFYSNPCPGPASIAPLSNITVNPADVGNLNTQRGDAAKSWNFALPAAWLDLDLPLLLTARVTLPAGIRECNGCEDGANSFSLRAVWFHPVAPLTIVPTWACVRRRANDAKTFCGQLTVSVRVTRGGVTTTEVRTLENRVRSSIVRDVFLASGSLFVQTYPVAQQDIRIQLRSGRTSYYDGDFDHQEGQMEKDTVLDFMDDVCDRLWIDRFFNRYPDSARDGVAVYFGIMPKPTGGGSGYGRPPSHDGFGRCAVTAYGQPASNLFGDTATSAQEVGHALEFEWHASCDHSEPKAGTPCLEVPKEFPCQHGGICTFGFDTKKLVAIDPRIGRGNHLHDFMSYGNNRQWWVSPFIYEKLFDIFHTEYWSLAPPQPVGLAAAPPGELFGVANQPREELALWVRARLVVEDEDLVRTEFLPAYQLQAPPTEFDLDPGAGEYSIEVLDEADNILYVRRFDPVFDGAHVCCDGDAASPRVSVSMLFPFDEATARLVLFRGDVPLAELRRSPNPPEVQLTGPEPETVWASGELGVVAWEAGDPDGDPLSFLLQYSDDGGLSWQAMALDLTQGLLEVEADDFAGSDQAAIRILVSDGLNTGEAVIGPFSVADKPPLVWISSPTNDDPSHQQGDLVILEGSGTDFEDGPLNEEALSWFSSEDGLLGRGYRVDAFELSPGVHEIVLEATDSRGQVARAETVVEVLERANRQPLAAVGPDLRGAFDQPIRLDGTLSSDPDGDPLRYFWSLSGQPEGSVAELSDAGAPQPEFIADVPGDYRFSLSVHDGQVGSLPAQLLVSVVAEEAGLPPVRTPQFVLAWGRNGGDGSEGLGEGEFAGPLDIAIHHDGTVYVADAFNGRIQVFDGGGRFLGSWGSPGQDEGQFATPRALAVDAEGHLYVADTDNHRVQKFDAGGNLLGLWGGFGDDAGSFMYPHGVAVAENGYVYVVDSGNHRVQKFDPDGTFLTMWGVPGPEPGQFGFPIHIATDREGAVYVTDGDSHRIQKFDGEGNLLASWGTFCHLYGDREGCRHEGAGQFAQPLGVATDPDGRVYVTDSLNHRVQVFDRDGVFVTSWGSFCFLTEPSPDSCRNNGQGQFNEPHGLAIDRNGAIYVVDTLNHRIQAFVLP